MKLRFIFKNSEFEVSLVTLVIWLFIIAILISASVVIIDELKSQPDESNILYYKYKSDQYQGILTNLTLQFKKANSPLYNNLANIMDNVNESAAKIGNPLIGDKAALVRFNKADTTVNKADTNE